MVKRINFKKKKGLVVALSLVGCLLIANTVFAASSGSTYINSTYGYLYGRTEGSKDSQEKFFSSYAETTKSVPRLRSSLEVQYYSTGVNIGEGENTDWVYNTSYAGTATYEMHHFKNTSTGKYDGFLNTKCKAYGTADAITSTPYVVFTNLVY